MDLKLCAEAGVRRTIYGSEMAVRRERKVTSGSAHAEAMGGERERRRQLSFQLLIEKTCLRCYRLIGVCLSLLCLPVCVWV
jgi:hypothetical protein